MTTNEFIERVKISQMMLCATAIQLHIGESDDAALARAANDYAQAVNQWRKAVESALDNNININLKIEAQA